MQESAAAKYGNENLFTIGHSQSGVLARRHGKDSKEQIIVNSAFNPLDLSSYKRNPKEYSIRSSSDIVSMPIILNNKIQSVLHPKWSKSHQITVPSSSLNPLTEHDSKIIKRMKKKRIGRK